VDDPCIVKVKKSIQKTKTGLWQMWTGLC